MAGRRLDADERALWRRVTENIRALPGGKAMPRVEPEPCVAVPASRGLPVAPAPPTGTQRHPPSNTLDGGWDRRLLRGLVAPDFTLDLHGHTLDSAWRALDFGLDRAIAARVRVVLLITGRAPRPDGSSRRGVIRAAIGDWLASSRHTTKIAAVRNAHPRHGGAGALYVILRRQD